MHCSLKCFIALTALLVSFLLLLIRLRLKLVFWWPLAINNILSGGKEALFRFRNLPVSRWV